MYHEQSNLKESGVMVYGLTIMNTCSDYYLLLLEYKVELQRLLWVMKHVRCMLFVAFYCLRFLHVCLRFVYVCLRLSFACLLYDVLKLLLFLIPDAADRHYKKYHSTYQALGGWYSQQYVPEQR